MKRARRPSVAALAGLGLLAGLVLAEGLLRLADVSFPRFWRSDPVLGIALRPDRRGWFVDEGRAFVTTNSLGFRDAERPRAKPPGAFRVLVLGDSFTEAVQVPAEKTFEKVAERSLASCPALKGRPVEVMNWGVRGYGTVEELELLRLLGHDQTPDAVVLADYPETDLLDNVRAWESRRHPSMIEEKDGRLEYTPATEARRQEVLAAADGDRDDPFPTNLRLYQVVEAAYTHWRHRAFWRQGLHNDVESADYPAAGAYRAPADAAWRRAWELQERLLDLFRRETAARGERAAVMVVSSPAQVFPEASQRERYARLWRAEDMLYPGKRLAAAARRLGLGFVDTVPALDAEVRRTGRPVHGFANTRPGYGHWNEEGHAVVGRVLADGLCALAGTRKAGR